MLSLLRLRLLAVAWLPPLPLVACAGGGSCDLSGDWGGVGYIGSLFQIVQPAASPNFTVFYSQAPQGLPGAVTGTAVAIPGWVGVIGTSPYRDLRTNATAVPCSYLNFNASKALWCKFPYCPLPEPPAPPLPAPTVQVPLTLLPQDAGDESPATLDGSPYGFYWKRSQTGKSTKWTISIEGGGWCYTEQECYLRSQGALGTSKAWPATMPFSLSPAGFHFRKWEMGCMNAEGNTLDMDCNALYLPYGDGASFAGFRAKPWPVPGTNDSLWFRGIKNLDAAIDWALLHGLEDATELVVTGVSAGGLSTFLHVDRIAQRVRSRSPSVQVHGAPVVGFFLDHQNYANDSATSYTAEMQYVYRMQNLTFGSDGGLMPACAAFYAPAERHKCVMSPHMMQFVRTPLFVFNSRFDAWQIGNILQIATWKTKAQQNAILEYGADFLTQFTAAAGASGELAHGAFISTCICHACPFPTLQLNGKTAFEHYAAWYLGKTRGSSSMHIDMRPPNGGGEITDPLCANFP